MDDRKDINIIKKAAELGLPEAQFRLATEYFHRNMREEALRWYKKAADGGNAVAAYELGKHYEYGRSGLGLDRDAKEAIKWYKKGAELGNTKCQYNLGHCYYTGTGVERNIVETYIWLSLAQRGGLHLPASKSHPDVIGKNFLPSQWAVAQEEITKRIGEIKTNTEIAQEHGRERVATIASNIASNLRTGITTREAARKERGQQPRAPENETSEGDLLSEPEAKDRHQQPQTLEIETSQDLDFPRPGRAPRPRLTKTQIALLIAVGMLAATIGIRIVI